MVRLVSRKLPILAPKMSTWCPKVSHCALSGAIIGHHQMSGSRGWPHPTTARKRHSHLWTSGLLTSQRKLNGEKENEIQRQSLGRIKPRPPCYNDDISALLADNEEITRSCHWWFVWPWVRSRSLGHLSSHLSSQQPSCIFLLNMSHVNSHRQLTTLRQQGLKKLCISD